MQRSDARCKAPGCCSKHNHHMSKETQASSIKVHPGLSMSEKLEQIHRGERRGLPCHLLKMTCSNLAQL